MAGKIGITNGLVLLMIAPATAGAAGGVEAVGRVDFE